VRGPLYDPPDEATQRRTALRAALDSLDADPLPYPDHPDAQAEADVPLADRTAPQGLAALAALAADLADAPLDDFATIWRLDAQLGQLAWDRSLAVLYLQTWEGAAPATLIAQYRTIAHTARTLLSRSWEQRSARMDCLDDLKLFISGTAAYVYALPDDPKLQAVDDLGQRLTTPWGPALIVDTPQRRSSAIKLAERLADLEAGCKPLLQAAQAGV
jgi:hypothetical protein